MKPMHLVLMITLAAALAACRTKPRGPNEPSAVCVMALAKHLQHTNPDALPAQVWYELLFKSYRDGISQDPVDCSGEPISWTALPESCASPELPGREIERKRVLTQEDLVVRNAGGDYWFGWAPFVKLENGMVEGPLAIVRLHHGRLEARALGNLRAFPSRARLEVRRLGDEHVLVAEGESCRAPSACSRATRLMWLDRQRFRVRPLRSATVRSCLGPAWFPQSERIETNLHKRWKRTLRRDLALAYQETRIIVDEHISVTDRDIEQASLPPRLFREAQAQIRIALEGGELVSEGQSLWSAIRVEDGSTELSPPASSLP